MREFIGGAALGFFIGMFIPRVNNYLIALLFGLMAWGLLP